MSALRRIFLCSIMALIGIIAWVWAYPAFMTAYKFPTISIPVTSTKHLFDLGVVDFDGDGWLDWFTTNHNRKQELVLGQGPAEFTAANLTDWGLSQRPELRNFEMGFSVPSFSDPGLYVYWDERDLVLHYREGAPFKHLAQVRITGPTGMRLDEESEISATVQKHTDDDVVVFGSVTVKELSEGILRVRPGLRAVPIWLELSEGVPLESVFIGSDAVPAPTRRINLALRDRHGLAFADVSGNGLLDVFIGRGGANGSLRLIPDEHLQDTDDELLMRTAPGRFDDVAVASGLRKRDCSSRKASWVDIDADGVLELFINCLDRGRVIDKPSSKQMYRKVDGHFVDMAQDLNLAAPEIQFRSFVWADFDNDGKPDLLGVGDRYVWLFHNAGNTFTRQRVGEFDVNPVTANSQLRISNHWQFNGKISLADYDRDGWTDAFISSSAGNLLLWNNREKLESIPPGSIGLPAHSLTADWVDFDNDGLVDLHALTSGIYRQNLEGTFERTYLLEFPKWRTKVALASWFDADQDGDRDLLLGRNALRWPGTSESGWNINWDLAMFRNDAATGNWLEVDLRGPASNRTAIGAVVKVTTPDGTQTQEVGFAEGSMFSQGHYRLYFGLGTNQGAALSVRWAGDKFEEPRRVEANRRISVAYPNIVSSMSGAAP